MSSRQLQHAAVAAFLLLTALAGSSQAAEENGEELLVDPTLPLVLTFTPAMQEEQSEGGFDLDLFSAFTSYELSSVLIRGENRVAVVNGQRVRVGDSVGSARVSAIEADRVTLNVNGKAETLELYNGSVKTLVKGDE